MPDVYATSDDVAARWRPLSEQETAQADALVVDASLKVRRKFPQTEARIASGDLDLREVAAVVAGMVKRAMLTGAEGVTQETENRGPFGVSRQYANPMGNLYFTAEDKVTLSGKPPRRAFSLDLTPGA